MVPPVLCIDEIYSTILKWTLSNSLNGRSTALALALTCKGLSEQALNFVWQDMPSLEPLGHLIYSHNMPAESYSATLLLFLETMHALASSGRPLPDTTSLRGLHRAASYAMKIKSLRWNQCRCWFAVTLALFGVTHPGEVLLPNLSRIRWIDEGEAFLHALSVLAGPKLTSLAVHVQWLSHPSLERLLQCLHNANVQLREITVEPTSEVMHTAVGRFLRNGCRPMHPQLSHQLDAFTQEFNLDNLVCFSSSVWLSPGALVRLAALPNLERLDVACEVPDFATVTSCGPLQFKTLKELTIRFPRLDQFATWFVALIEALNLRTLLLQIATPLDASVGPQLFEELINALRCTKFFASLDTFSLRESCDRDPGMADFLNLKNLLQRTKTPQALLSNRRSTLRLLALVSSSLEPDDALLQDIALAFPQLRCLCLHRPAQAGQPSKVTLAGVHALSTLCAHLDMPYLAVDARSRRERRFRVVGPANPCYNLVQWDVLDSRIDGAADVSRFFTCTFPNLRRLRSYPCTGGEQVHVENQQIYKEKWDTVAEIVACSGPSSIHKV